MSSTALELPRSDGGARERARDRLLAFVFVIALAAPGLGLLVGVRPPAIENRFPATLPPLTARALTQPAYFAGVDRFVVDAFPLRADAVQLRARLFYALGSPSVRTVVIGRDGWLFLSEELVAHCIWSADEALAMWDAAASTLESAGKDAWLVVAPDKHTAYPEEVVPNQLLGTPCTTTERASMRAGMAARPHTTVDLWTPVLERRGSDPSAPLYYKQDSHWNIVGAYAAIPAMVTAIAPGTWSEASVQSLGESRRLVGLSVLLGIPSYETAPDLQRVDVNLVERVVPSPLDALGGRSITEFRTTGPGPVVPGRTLVIHDSFFGVCCMRRVASWFADSIWLHVDDLTLHPEVVAALPDYDRVVMERAERLAYLTDYTVVLRPLLERLTPTASGPSPR